MSRTTTKTLKCIQEQTLEFKISYINAISFFLSKNPNKVKEEKLINLIKLLELDEMQEDLLEFLQAPEEDELAETFETISEYGITYITNLFYFLDKDNFTENEKKFLEFVTNKFELSNNTVEFISSFVHTILAVPIRELSSEIVKDEELTNGLESFATLYSVSNPKAETLKHNIEEYSKLSSQVFKELLNLDKSNSSASFKITKQITKLTLKLFKAGDYEYERLSREFDELNKEKEIRKAKYEKKRERARISREVL